MRRKMASNFHNTLPKYYSASRELRNQAEKQRRDKLNYHVTELASLVPFVTRAQKKVDKTSVLRLAASYIRMHKILRKSESTSAKSMPVALLNADTSRTLLNSIGGFLLVITSVGKVIYASEAIEDTFGYSQADVLGQSFYSLIHQDDEHLVQQQLCPQESFRRSFYCRMLEKSISRSDPRRYEIIHVVGQFKPLPVSEVPKVVLEEKPVLRAELRRRTRSEACTSEMSDDEDDDDDDACSVASSSASTSSVNTEAGHDRTGTHMLVAFVQVVHDKPITELSWVESMRDEYITRHRLDGNISYVDHRISFVTGMMPEEVLGNSAFQYMHPDDILWSIIAQKQMLGSSHGHGMVTYRLVCKDGSCVSLRTRGFLEVNKDTGKVDTFVCINTLLRESDAEEEVKSQRKQLLPLVSGQSHEDLALVIGKDLPPELGTLVKGLINRQTLNRMLNSVENVSLSKIERGITLGYPHLTKKLSSDPDNSDHCKSRQRTSSHSGFKEPPLDSSPSVSGCISKSLKKRSRKVHSVNTNRKSSVDRHIFSSTSQASTIVSSKNDPICFDMESNEEISSISVVSQSVVVGGRASNSSPSQNDTSPALESTDCNLQCVSPSNINVAESGSSMLSNFYNYEPNSPTEWSMIDSLAQDLDNDIDSLYSPDAGMQANNYNEHEETTDCSLILSPTRNDSSLQPSMSEADPYLTPSSAMEVSGNNYSPFPQSFASEAFESSRNQMSSPTQLIISADNDSPKQFQSSRYSLLTLTSRAQPVKDMLNYSSVSENHKKMGFIS